MRAKARGALMAFAIAIAAFVTFATAQAPPIFLLKGAAKDAREERATVRRIVADFHHLTVSQLTNFEKNKGRTPKIP